MKSALFVYSFACLLRIAYTKLQDNELFVQEAAEDVREKAAQFNESTKLFIEHLEQDNEKKKGIMKVFGYAHGDYNVATRILAGITTLGASEAVNGGLKIGKGQMDKSTKRKTEQIESLKMDDNIFADCIQNIAIILCNPESIYLDEGNLYYEYATPLEEAKSVE